MVKAKQEKQKCESSWCFQRFVVSPFLDLTAAGAQRNSFVGAYTICPQNFQHPARIILISLVPKCLQMVIFCFST